ncbi:hypothetical protein GWI33_006620 [Rhynchophorus ferrugineus]|uniref:Cilia- and flagella-associated protein 36 n=1 Tax=Rhynchophorus ferrugineus TaxID=354439 RepID=A0A834MFC4_RHYFE|nr:hypothetical protein GWI33_006620 [Rhynchophorus ferrugineus]
MAAEDDSDWVFDSLVCFLNGPIWNAPLQSFIEEKSLIFEPSVIHHDDYNAVFEEFKNLVDFMLGNFMEDIGISSQQFHEACSEGKKHHLSFDNTLFEQIWAANDFDMFIRMMTQKNVELQLQALELIEKKYGITPQSFVPKAKSDQEEEEATHSVRIVPITIETNESKLEKQVLEEAAKKFSVDEPVASTSELENLMEQKPILEQKLKESIMISTKNEDKDAGKETVTSREEKEEVAIVDDSKKETIINVRQTQEIDALELKKRQDYLRSQRDKLVALKKEARQKQLTTETAKKTKERPKSARAAEALLTGEKPVQDPGQLQLRKTLAEKLKAEVVSKEQK